MHRGGQLIREFDAFLHLLRSAAQGMHAPVAIPQSDQLELNRVLAGLGGPPAPAQVRIELAQRDALAACCLFLVTGKDPCPVLLHDAQTMGRARQLVHIVAHALVPMVSGGAPLDVDQVSTVLTETEMVLRPTLTYNEDGDVAGLVFGAGASPMRAALAALGHMVAPPPAGAALVPMAAGWPAKVAVNPAGPVLPDHSGDLQPVVVHVTWRTGLWPQLQV